jgi:uroporphyrinogen-III decarboxylase
MILYDSQIVVNSHQEEIMKQQYFDANGLKAATRFLQSQSVTLSAIHFCFDNPEMAAPMRTFQDVIGLHGRVRFRTYRGK